MIRAISSLVAILAVAACGGASTALNAAPSLPDEAAARSIAKDLYITDFGTHNVEVLTNTNYSKVGMIKNGLSTPDGDFLSKDGALFVANYGGKTITEYAPGAKMPSFTYSEGMYAPVDVTVDARGNVYEADFHGYVNEYARHSNATLHTCTPSGGVEGVAVDPQGDVFVSFNPRFGNARIAEYKGGLSGCQEKVFGPQFKFVGGIALDAQRNLIVCDQRAAKIDVLKPPYQHVTSTLGSNFTGPFHITLSKNNKLAFVADPYLPGVFVLAYPSGRQIALLGTANGLTQPAGAVDWPNAVY
jgi:hypothetical protein